MFDDALVKEAARILERYKAEGLKLVTAESCTGGLISALFTEVIGSSSVFERGFVTYSNEAKVGLLGVPFDVLDAKGAVSPEVAVAMAEGALANSYGDVAVSVTGIAGPGGGSAEKPVGLVYIAAKRKGGETKVVEQRFGKKHRSTIRMLTVRAAIGLL